MRPVYLKFLPAVLSAGLIGLTGCNNEYSLENEEVVSFRHAYEDNFVKAFGSIDPNQSWDFSSYAKQKRQSESQTRAVTEYVSVAKTDGVDDEWYSVDDNTLTWLKNNLKEGENHLGQMKSSIFRTEENTVFEVVPIYQGMADLYWELRICTKVDGSSSWTDTYLWEKGLNMMEYSWGQWREVGNTDKTCNSLDADHIKAKPIRVDIPANCSFYFYLHNLRNTGENAAHLNAAVGQKNSSIDNPAQIAALKNLDRPGNIPSDYSAVVLGCEDMKYGGEYVDMDYNDMVFLLVGYIPEIIYDEEMRETIVRKRYLIEDFGGFDYDFNDVIVDVAQTTSQKYRINTETKEAEPVGDATVGQEATISYFCGTMPVQVKVGDTFFGQVTDPTADAATVEAQLAHGSEEFGGDVCTRTDPPVGTEVSYTKTITGWDPDANNISVYVWTKLNPEVARPSEQTDDIWTTTGIWTSTFPENGAVPYIIAVDQGVMPDGEGVQYSKITVEKQ